MASFAGKLRKGVKKYRKLVFELPLGMFMVNARVVFKHVRRKKVGIRAFQKELVGEL